MSPMPDVVHLVDDTALGGVMRVVATLGERLPGIVQRTVKVDPRRPASVRRVPGRTLVVHFTLSWAKLPWLAATRLLNLGSRIVLVEHSYTRSFEAANVPDVRRFRAMLRAGYSLTDGVGAVSTGQWGWMVGSGLVRDPRKIAIVPCAVPSAPFLDIPPPAPRGGAPLHLGAFGRYHPQKGFDVLVRAMRDVPPGMARLSLNGYGDDEAMFRELAEGLPHVSIGGRVDAREFLSSVDAVAMPSRWEAGAVTCWETRSAARAMIVSDVDGLPEQIGPAWGFVVPPGDVPALSAAIRDLAGSDARAMGAAARGSVEGGSEAALLGWERFLSPETSARIG